MIRVPLTSSAVKPGKSKNCQSFAIIKVRKATVCHLFLLFGLASPSHAQNMPKQNEDYLRFMFYNVENFFDASDDSTTNDNDFTPEGSMHWTQNRHADKRNSIFRVIANTGEWDPPAMVALCEIENRSVLNGLIKNTPLVKFPYRIVHKESPDLRGIDVALLYRGDYLKCISEQFVHVRLSGDRRQTRDILFATLLTSKHDTVHVFVNHWPSRSGGERQSEPSRLLAASLVRHKADSIFRNNPLAKIIIAGDLNDSPLDKSLIHGLNALNDTSKNKTCSLFNLTAYKMHEETGTIKYQGKWSVFDQIIVSGGLLGGMPRTTVDKCRIFRAGYLFELDRRYSGTMPFRTYTGQKYNSGFSDHLPVYLDIRLK